MIYMEMIVMEQNRPNLVYIFADQWRREAVGFMGREPVKTPHIDKFAQQSLCFDQAVTSTPICSPHRASLMTGKYALSTGVYTNCKIGLTIGLDEQEVTISDVLKSTEYHTAYIGKWHLDCPEQNMEEHPRSGASDWDAYTPPGPKRHQFDYWYSYGTHDEHLTPHYWHNSDDMIQIEEWSVKHETDMALSYMEQIKEKKEPFALFLSWNPPHSPFDLVPAQYKEQYETLDIKPQPNVIIQDPFLVHTGENLPGGEKVWQQSVKDYYAAITGIDEQFARMIEKLEQLNMTENTIVVLTSDHGELLGAHGLLAKHSWHEESIGVPLMIRYPQKLSPMRSQSIMNTVDIMPTILNLMEVDIPQTVQGQSIMPLVAAEQQGDIVEEWDNIAYISAFPGRIAAIEQFQAAGLNHLVYGWRGIRTRNYTYVVNKGYEPYAKTEKLLYDLKSDPCQRSPIVLAHAKQHPIAERLEKILLKYLDMTKDEFDIG